MAQTDEQWDRRMEILNGVQTYLDSFYSAIEQEREAQRPGSSSAKELSEHPFPRTALLSIASNHATQNTALGMALLHQMQFNQTVIQMLTELDHRKADSPTPPTRPRRA